MNRYSKNTNIRVIVPQGCLPAPGPEEKQRLHGHRESEVTQVSPGDSGSASKTQLEKEARGSRQSPGLESDLGSYPGVSPYRPAPSPPHGVGAGESKQEDSFLSIPGPRRRRFRNKEGKRYCWPILNSMAPSCNFSFLLQGPFKPGGLNKEVINGGFK